MAEKKINGQTYRSSPVDASTAIKLYVDLTRIATKATGRLAALITTMTSDEDDNAIMADLTALAAIGDILKSTETDELLDLMIRLADCVEVKRPSGYAKIIFDDEFSGNLRAIVPVLRFAVEAQFADFFTGSAGSGAVQALRKILAQKK